MSHPISHLKCEVPQPLHDALKLAKVKTGVNQYTIVAVALLVHLGPEYFEDGVYQDLCVQYGIESTSSQEEASLLPISLR